MLNWPESLFADWKRGRRTGSGSESEPDGTNEEGPTGESAADRSTDREEAPTSWTDLLDQGEVSRRDVRLELGLQPDEFLVGLVRSSGGRMWQADLVETTGWSKSTVSRYLDGLETSGTVERVWIGRRKLVRLPEAAPETPDAAEGPSVDSRPGSWVSENDELT